MDEDLIPRTHDTAAANVTEQDDDLIKEADEMDELDDILGKPRQKSRNPKNSEGLSENYPSDTFSSEQRAKDIKTSLFHGVTLAEKNKGQVLVKSSKTIFA